MEFRNVTLPNGLRIIAEVDPRAFSCSLGYFVVTGSRDETDAEAGLSHYLEHMVFKGSERRGPDDVNREFDRFGADYNAATSEEQTVYYSSQLPEYLPRALELWSDLLRPALRDADFDTEKEVILEEIGMYADAPPYSADDWCKELYFNGHSLGRSVLGTTASVTALTSVQMRDYFVRRYSPHNLVLAVSGQVDFDDLCRRAEALTNTWQGGPAPRATATVRAGKGYFAREQPQSTQQYVLQFAPGPWESGLDRRAARLAARIIGDGSGSRLYWALVDTGLAESASMHYQSFQDCGTFQTYLTCTPEDLAVNLETAGRIVREALADGIRPEELERARNKVCSGIILGSERPRSRLFGFASRWIRDGEYRTVRESIEQLEAVRVEDVERVLRTWSPLETLTVTVGPLTPQAAEAARHDAVA